jgi:CHAT domain-containing protein
MPVPEHLGTVRLSVSATGAELSAAVAQGTILHRARIAYDAARVADLSGRIVAVLARGARQRTLTQPALADLRTLGEELARAILPAETRADLAELDGQPLLLEIDEALVAVPWELLFDGRKFLCRRFDLGRTVVMHGPRRAAPARRMSRPAQMLIVCSDPRGDLAAVADEGQAIVDALDAHRGVSVRMASGKGVEFVRKAMKDYDFLHFAGHAEHDSGDPAASAWLLADGKLTARAIAELSGGRSMPFLVFANGCASAHAGGAESVFGLANAFLTSGVRYYIGTQWEIVDAQSRVFATSFYTELGRGRSIGAAARRAREAVIVAEGEGGLGWAGYVVYGDPVIAPLAAEDAPNLPPLPTPAQISSRESIKGVVKRVSRPLAVAPPRVRDTGLPLWLFVALAALIVGVAAAFILGR